MALEALSEAAPKGLIEGLILIPSDEEIALYGGMRDEYLFRVKKEPAVNRYLVALSVGAKAFGIPIPVLQARRNQKRPDLTEDRRRLMAFSRVVSFGHRLNEFAPIARSFHRTHPAAMSATHKYGALILAAMDKA